MAMKLRFEPNLDYHVTGHLKPATRGRLKSGQW